MANNSDSESGGSIAALFDEGARLFDDMAPLWSRLPPGVGKTPTTPSRVADLATAVDGGSGTQRIYSPSGQGRLVLSIHTEFTKSYACMPCVFDRVEAIGMETYTI